MDLLKKVRSLSHVAFTTYFNDEDESTNLSVRDKFNNKNFLLKYLLLKGNSFFREYHKNEIQVCSCKNHFLIFLNRRLMGRPKMTARHSVLYHYSSHNFLSSFPQSEPFPPLPSPR